MEISPRTKDCFTSKIIITVRYECGRVFRWAKHQILRWLNFENFKSTAISQKMKYGDMSWEMTD